MYKYHIKFSLKITLSLILICSNTIGILLTKYWCNKSTPELQKDIKI